MCVEVDGKIILDNFSLEIKEGEIEIEKSKKKIEEKKEKYGWEFLFIGANIDAVETASRYGIGADRAVNYNADKEGTSIVYESVSRAVCNVRENACVDADWSNEINADYVRRGKKW